MEFKKGDVVEVWGDDENFFTKAEYFAFNDHPEAEYSKYPHMVRLYKRDGTTEPNIYCYSNCRHARPNLKMDDPVWVLIVRGWQPRHFAGWSEEGDMKYWENGRTSHTSKGVFIVTTNYRLTSPDSE